MEERILSVLCVALGLEKVDTAISQDNCENWDYERIKSLLYSKLEGVS